MLKLVMGVVVMAAVLGAVMWLMPAWDTGLMPIRIARLGVLVAAGLLAYFGTLGALGFRPGQFSRSAVQ